MLSMMMIRYGVHGCDRPGGQIVYLEHWSGQTGRPESHLGLLPEVGVEPSQQIRSFLGQESKEFESRNAYWWPWASKSRPASWSTSSGWGTTIRTGKCRPIRAHGWLTSLLRLLRLGSISTRRSASVLTHWNGEYCTLNNYNCLIVVDMTTHHLLSWQLPERHRLQQGWPMISWWCMYSVFGAIRRLMRKLELGLIL